jgi:hypothetical protein
MSSITRIITRFKFDDSLLKQELKVLEDLPRIKEQYDEFAYGSWINHSLWNNTGKWRDTQFMDLDQSPKKTEIAHQMPYLCQFIENTFDLEHMTMARIRNLVDGGVIPHIDFLELSENKYGYVRILIPLETCIDSYHTEESFGVFRMRKGELWVLESQVPHAAYNLGNDNRRILSIDFHYTDEESPHWSRILKDKSAVDEVHEPAFIPRSSLSEEEMNEYIGMLAEQFVDKYSAEDVLKKLMLLQLKFTSPVSDVYENLILVAKRTGNQELVDHAINMRRFYIGSRVMDERFIIRKDMLEAEEV